MKWTIDADEEGSFIRVVTEGRFSLSGTEKMVQDVLSSNHWHLGSKILFDHRNLDWGSTDVSVMRSVAELHEKYEEQLGKCKIAVLMKSLTDFGRGRQYQLLAEPNVSADICISTDLDEIIAWFD